MTLSKTHTKIKVNSLKQKSNKATWRKEIH